MTQQLKGFNTYEDYLDSQLVDEDLYYLKVIIWEEMFLKNISLRGCGVCPADPGAGLQVGSEGAREGGVL